MNYGKIIKELRLQKGITQKELANILGISPSSISRYENGKKFKAYAICRFAKYFEVTTDFMLGIKKIIFQFTKVD